jgi:hypothetical protein
MTASLKFFGLLLILALFLELAPTATGYKAISRPNSLLPKGVVLPTIVSVRTSRKFASPIDLKTGEFDVSEQLKGKYLMNFIILPIVAATTIPFLLGKITDFDINAFERQYYIIALLISKRLILYSTALNVLEISSFRSITAEIGLGKRLKSINDELFDGLFNVSFADDNATQVAYDQLDRVDGSTQAALLPVILFSFLLNSRKSF